MKNISKETASSSKNEMAARARRTSMALGLPKRRRVTMQLSSKATEQLAQAKILRDRRKDKMSSVHDYVIDYLAFLINQPRTFVEEDILDSLKGVDHMSFFFQKNGLKSIMFFFQQGKHPEIECGRLFPMGSQDTVRLEVTNGKDVPFSNLCIFFYKFKDHVEITARNFSEMVGFGVINTAPDFAWEYPMPLDAMSLVRGISFYLNYVADPLLNTNKNWNKIEEAKDGFVIKKDFLNSFDYFVANFKAVTRNIEGRVFLEQCYDLDLSQEFTLNEIKAMSNNPVKVVILEELIGKWCKQIEKVLAESEQIRKESEDVGPLTELEHWLFLLARFHSVMTQVKMTQVKNCVKVLIQARSVNIKAWNELVEQLTNAYNAAKDNVKYLYIIKKFSAPLYKFDLNDVRNGITSLISVIRMIYSVSKYYNTAEHMTALFVKVTNQLVKACKKYITNDGELKIWDQPMEHLHDKLSTCMDVYRHYKESFQSAKKEAEETPGDRPFNFSEMYVFGRFEAFCKRLSKIQEMINAIQTFKKLKDSFLDEIEPVIAKFDKMVKEIQEKDYDHLDHRNPEFDQDCENFKDMMITLKDELRNILDRNLDNVTSTGEGIRMLQRYATLGISELNLEQKYSCLLHFFGEELSTLSEYYTQHRLSPVFPHYLPPYSGRISWARHLYLRIEEPMMVLKDYTDKLHSQDAFKIVRAYNELARVLIHYETLYHMNGQDYISTALEGIQSTILVLNPKTKEYHINFDAKIFHILREVECFTRLTLKIPFKARSLYKRRKSLKRRFWQLKSVLNRYERLQKSIPPAFVSLLEPLNKKVSHALEPGALIISWTSLTINDYFAKIEEVLKEFDFTITQVIDIMNSRIDGPLLDIAYMELISLPQKNFPQELHDFLKRIKANLDISTHDILNKSNATLASVDDLTSIFNGVAMDCKKTEMDQESYILHLYGFDQRLKSSVKFFTEPSSADTILEEELFEFKRRVSFRIGESLVLSIRRALEFLLSKITFTNPPDNIIKYTKEEESSVPPALFTTTIQLAYPRVVIFPSLDDIQSVINKTSQAIIDISNYIPHWGEKSNEAPPVVGGEESPKAINPENSFYKLVVENSDISKCHLNINAVSQAILPEVKQVLDSYQDYSHLWTGDKYTTVKAFMDSNPLLVEVKEKMQEYVAYEEEIMNGPYSYNFNLVEVVAEDIKNAIFAEAKGFKKQIGNQLLKIYHNRLMKNVEFLHENTKKLGRPIKDLDDIRSTMATLDIVREHEIELEKSIPPIEEAYKILQQFEMPVDKEDVEKVDTLMYDFLKMKYMADKASTTLVVIQENFKGGLQSSIEKFKKDVVSYAQSYYENGPMEEGISPAEASCRVTFFQSQMDHMVEEYERYKDGEELFGLPVTEYPELGQVNKEIQLLTRLYGLYDQVMETIGNYYTIPWGEIDIETIINQIGDFVNRCKRLPKALKDWQAYKDLQKKIDDFSETCPLLEMMTNKAMLPRHWRRLAEVTGYTFEIDSETFALKDVVEAPLLEFKDEVEDICVSAVKEKDIEAKLKQVIAEWDVQKFSFSTFKNRGELLLKGAETVEIITMLEDSLMVLQTLLSNRYNVPFKSLIQLWTQKLTITSDIIEIWLQVQNLWIYLEAVFVGGDIARQLPKEAKRFSTIDKSWMKVMFKAHDVSVVVECCTGDEVLGQMLPHLLEQLEITQKSLVGYLEAKRMVFPRFFFISDPALLEILGQAGDSHTIQAHLLGVSENIAEVTFSEKEYDTILACKSREKEEIVFLKPVVAKGNVEIWLGELLAMQQKSLNLIVRDAFIAINKPDFELIRFLSSYISQVGLLGIQLLWTRDSEVALSLCQVNKRVMNKANQKFLDILRRLIERTTTDLTKYERIKYETLITIHVHQRDIFDDLVKTNIRTLTDFDWLKQARFYYDLDRNFCTVGITDVQFIYQNEFLGCTDRLVITPLTDRCYITLGQAIGMSLGGAPAGPAGTGKTETTKDMGKALGKFVVVFNCSDQMDFRGLGRIFKGLAQSGSWGCFDEFNRIDLPVLSVAAQQIYLCLMARKERKKQFIFSDGDTVDLNSEFGFFITMNPGYAGRQELPENLKVLFRSVAMMVPDRQIIMRVKLASCGFQENIILARKFFVLYKLCEEQLTKQVHYDFGLRNILSVLRTLGAEKRKRPGDSEATIMMRVLRDMNISKLVDEDEPLFLSLISDLFPGIVLDNAVYEDLQDAIAKEVEVALLINHPTWNLKLVQLFETQRVRHGMMVLGPSGAGKTCCIHVLMRAMTLCGAPHKEMRMNPKAITAPQMFGRLDVATNDWTDGIFSTLWRKSLKAKKGDHIWLLLDGPVDAIWIENLNSVLDDNKTLTLANGDRIPMAPTCKIVFEVHNIDNASPATVSRNGMVFMSSSVLEWRPILDGWLLKRSDYETTILRNLFKKVFDELKTMIITTFVPKIKLLECNYIRQAMDILQGLIPHPVSSGQMSEKHIEKIFIFSLMWSIGASLELEDRGKMEAFLLKHPSKLALPKPNFDAGETIFEFVVNDEGEWEHWQNRVEEYIYPSDSIPAFGAILVPNVDNVRTNFLIKIIAEQSKPVLLIGEQGTAKTVMIMGYLDEYNPELHAFKSISFSSATTPMMFQRTIESFVDKRMGTTYGPPAGKRMTVFIDDVNMPIINEWGDQVTNEIVRQLLEMKGFYSLDKPGEFLYIVDMQFLAAMIHPGGGRNDIPERLKRAFCVFNCTLPSNNSIDKIFGIIGCGYFCPTRFNQTVVDFIPNLVPTTRRLWQQTKIKMLPTPAKFHYVFNLRDLSRIWQGMLKVQNDECQTEVDVLGLWKNECICVIADRFTNVEDKKWFQGALYNVINENLGASYANQLPAQHLFVNFMRDAPEPTGEEPPDFDFSAPKTYEWIHDIKIIINRLKHFMELHNETVRGSHLDLVCFQDAVIYLIKISRIITTARGNALLVGVGGSGKQSLTKLASFIANFSTFQITLTRSYSTANLADDIKYLYTIGGAKGQGITFIFTDNDIKDEAFLEYLNNVLSSGEVANLFPKDEIQEIQDNLVPVMKKEFPKLPPTQENLYDYFLTRAKNNIHVVLCFSPVGEKFRSRSLKFPGLISGCTILWFQPWPQDALVAVSDYYLKEFSIICRPETKRQVVLITADIHQTVAAQCIEYFQRFRRQTFVTPKSYLSFLTGYKGIYTKSRLEIEGLSRRINSGLDKMLEAVESVNLLKIELAEMDKELIIKNAEAQLVLNEVTQVATAAEKVKAEVMTVKNRAEKIVAEIKSDKAVAEVKLEAAKPALEEAEQSLQTIKSADIATVRKLGKPPHLIMRIMDCVLILFLRRLEMSQPDPEKPCPKTTWSESLKMMSDTKFMSQLQNFPKDTINEEMVELMQPYLRMEDYNLESAKKVCGNVAGLCSWTQAMAFFYSINKEVLPLKANLAVQEARLERAMDELSRAEQTLQEKQKLLDQAQKLYDEAMRGKQELEDAARKLNNKMLAAEALIDGLAGERLRWTNDSKEFTAQIERLVGDALLCTGFLSYAGPFNQEFRSTLLTVWQRELRHRRIPYTTNLNLISMLTDGATLAEWSLQGLPNDDLSIQNGIIVTKASRFPLLIDPQGQGKQWIKNKEKELVITNLNHKYFRNHLEDALSLGKALLLEDIQETLDPSLDNVLDKNFIKSGTTFKVKLGDKETDVNKDFKIFITTKLPNPSFSPEISARTSIIDFTVTMRGLEDQLLGRVILTEKRELEAERTSLIESVAENKRTMQMLEDNLLYKLSSIQGSLVEDESLISVLTTTKTMAADVSHKLIVAADTEIMINKAREEFRPVANRGSILYFLICDMSMVNVMYQTSLNQFLGLFDISMARSDRSFITTTRINNIIEYLTFEVFRYTCRSLYETHKFLFTLLLALKIDSSKDNLTHEEFQTFVKGGAALDIKSCPPKPYKWITDMTWLNLVEISKLPPFKDIISKVQRNNKIWKAWFETDAPEEEEIPDGYHVSLDVFRKLILIRAWSPDRTLAQARKYIGSALGLRYSQPVILNLEATWHESTVKTPLICLLSMGSDPTSQIEGLAKRQGIKCSAISMGQGQEVHARKLMFHNMANGGWMLLQNCHLGLEFMEELLETLLEAPTSDFHETFRVWITTEVHPGFSISLLQLSIKFTNEPPQGIKAGIKRTYQSITQEQLDLFKYPQWQPMLYSISFLHTVVQERRKFGPLGWNIPYEFNTADWAATVQYFQNHLDDMDPKEGVSWKTIHYMIGEVQYGGRVTDDYDKRLLNTFAAVWFGENIFDEEFCYYTGYPIPKCITLTEYFKAIDELPNVDSPQAFGLHPNADITYQTNTANNVLDTIISIQPKDSAAGGGETREAVVYRLAEEMLAKLPRDYIPHEVRARIQKMGALNSMNIFLRQEIDRMQRVIVTVRITLNDLKLAIDGTIIMNEVLRDALDCIFDARVPKFWLKISWDSATIGFWFTELLERNDQFFRWVFTGRPDQFWMTGFFNPQGFLTAMRQEVSRAHTGWALDQVTLHNDVTKFYKEEISQPPPEGVYVYGLYLDGAAFDRKNLVLIESFPKALFAILPVVHIYAINSTAPKDPALYMCPVYKKPRRTDLTYITPLWIKTVVNPKHWILRGVALLCDIS